MKKQLFSLKKTSFLAFTLLAFFSCNKDEQPNGVIEPSNNNTNPPTTTVVNADYVLTNEFRGPKNVLVLWKDGVSRDISDGTVDEVGIDMKISGNDVYILAQANFTSTARAIRLYKNGTLTDITVPSATTTPAALEVIGTDVYIAGSYYNATTNNETLAYWKNGTKTDLLSNVFFSKLNDIKVVNNSVYVLGSIRNTNGNSEVTYWKDSVKTNIANPAGTNSEARSFDVVGNTIYTVGVSYTSLSTRKIPYRWDNTTGNPISTTVSPTGDEFANDVTVSNGNVCIVGEANSGGFRACMWKDAVQTTIQTSTTFPNFAKRVQVNGTIVYAGGTENFTNNIQKAIVWKSSVGAYYVTSSATSSALIAMQFKP